MSEPNKKTQTITIEIGGNADGLNAILDSLQQKADKLVATLEKAEELACKLTEKNS